MPWMRCSVALACALAAGVATASEQTPLEAAAAALRGEGLTTSGISGHAPPAAGSSGFLNIHEPQILTLKAQWMDDVPPPTEPPPPPPGDGPRPIPAPGALVLFPLAAAATLRRRG